jgi:hypothetical protein
MKLKLKIKLFVSLFLACVNGCSLVQAAVTSYGGSHISAASTVYSVKVNGTSIFVHNYEADDGEPADPISFLHYAHFGASDLDYSSGVQVEITYKDNIVAADTRISPTAYGIPYFINGKVLTFTLYDNKKVFVGINLPLVQDMNSHIGSRYMLGLFPDRIDPAAPQPGGANVVTVSGTTGTAINNAIAACPSGGAVYVPSGSYNGQVNINKDNITVYLAPGAYLHRGRTDSQTVVISGRNNVTLKGRGVVEGWDQVVSAQDCSNLTIEGIIYRSTGRLAAIFSGKASGFAFYPHRLTNSVVQNMKLMRYPPKPRAADGMDPDSCNGLSLLDNLVYAGDDAYCFKSLDAPTADVLNNLVEGNVAYTPASSYKYGSEIAGGVHDNIWRNNYTVYGGLMFCGRNYTPYMQSLTVSNMVIENGGASFLSVGFGRFDTPNFFDLNLTLDNITVDKIWPQNPPSFGVNSSGTKVIDGYYGMYIKAKTGKAVTVTFNNLKVQGQYISSLQQLLNMGLQPYIGGAGNSDTTDDGTVTLIFNVTAVVSNTPAAPSNLTATLVASNQINLAWTDNSTNETQFRIEIKVGGGAYAFLANTPSLAGSGGTGNYSDTNLSAGTTYTYRVRADGTNGNDSAWSNEASASTPGGSGGLTNWYEAELMMIAATSAGDPTENFAEPNASGGTNSLLTANAIGDFITYTVNIPWAGHYNVRVTLNKAGNRGRCNLYVDGSATTLGAEMELYNATGYAYQEVDQGDITFTNAGAHTFRFQVSGKHPSATAYKLAFDYLKLIKSTPAPLVPPTVTGAAVSGNNFVLTFSTEVGGQYEVLRTDTFSPPVWIPVETSILGTGGTIQITDTNALNRSNTFYRVQRGM